MFNKVMTGGACQPSGEAAGINQNALTSLMDNMIMGDARARQMNEGYKNAQQQQDMQQMQMMEM
jgi:hypothetical protein